MRQILKYIRPLALLGGGFALALWILSGTRAARAQHIISSVLCENTPIAELATRKIVWKVFTVDRTVSKDSFRDTTYTMRIGYDLAACGPDQIRIDETARTVILSLPPPKILAIDDTLQRTVVETKTFFERVFGENVSAGETDLKDLRQLAADCEKYDLLAADAIREGLVTFLAAQLKEACGYQLVVKDGLSLPATVMFNAYFEEKGVGFRL